MTTEGTDWSHGRKEPRAEGCRFLWTLEKAGNRPFLGASRKNRPCSHLALSPVKLVSDLLLASRIIENTCVLF